MGDGLAVWFSLGFACWCWFVRFWFVLLDCGGWVVLLATCYVGFGLVVLRWVGGNYCVVNLIWWFAVAAGWFCVLPVLLV